MKLKKRIEIKVRKLNPIVHNSFFIVKKRINSIHKIKTALPQK